MPCPNCGQNVKYYNSSPSAMKGREYDYSYAECIGNIEREGISKSKDGKMKWRIKYKDGKTPCGWDDGKARQPKQTTRPITSGTRAVEPKKHTPVETDPRTYLIDWHDGN
tara:strand:- start:504 stop:833 length:330 start_codon:yes stop_codon:yes gene_type:complete